MQDKLSKISAKIKDNFELLPIPKTTKIYREQYLFDDSEVTENVCSLKQTTHSAAIIAGLMTGFFTNHITNLKNNNTARFVPFKTEYFIPLNLFENV